MDKIYMKFPGFLRKALTLSYDDGVEQDSDLLKLIDKYGIKATFNLNSGCFVEEGHVFPSDWLGRRVTVKKALELYNKNGHEVAVHTVDHPHLEELSRDECTRQILEDRLQLEKWFGGYIRGMAYPFGTYNDMVLEVMRECGIVYSRTCESKEDFEDFKLPDNWLTLPATCHHCHPRLMELAHKFVEAKEDGEPMMFYLWGHAYEFERDNNWYVMEEFCDYIGKRDNIWYATNIEIYDYQKAFKSLIYSADGTRIYNPSAKCVYLSYKNKNYMIKPGEEIAL